jgi:hypothetical protein
MICPRGPCRRSEGGISSTLASVSRLEPANCPLHRSAKPRTALDYEGHAPALARDGRPQSAEIVGLVERRIIRVHPRLQALVPDQGLAHRLGLAVEDIEDGRPPVEAEAS